MFCVYSDVLHLAHPSRCMSLALIALLHLAAARQTHVSLLLCLGMLSLATLVMLLHLVNLICIPLHDHTLTVVPHVTSNVMSVIVLIETFVIIEPCCGADTQAQISATLCNYLVHLWSCSHLSWSWHLSFKLTPWPPTLSQSTATIPRLTR